jgi:hypothetical protein
MILPVAASAAKAEQRQNIKARLRRMKIEKAAAGGKTMQKLRLAAISKH